MTFIETIKRALNSIEKKSLKTIQDELSVHVASNLIEEKDPIGRTAMHWASRYNREDVMEWLSSLGLSVHDKDVDGSTPTHIAAMNGSDQAMNWLIQRNVDLNAKRNDGKTPLVFAHSLKVKGPSYQKTFDLLMKSSVDDKAVDEHGKTAEDHAKEFAKQLAQIQSQSKEINPLQESLRQSWVELQAATQPPKEPIKIETSEEGKTSTNINLPREEALMTLKSLGFEWLGTQEGESALEGREPEVKQISTLLEKQKNVMLIGPAGIGKRTMAHQVADALSTKGKVVLSVPQSAFRGNKYAGSVNESIQKWLNAALSLGSELVLYIPDAHQLSTGKTSSDQSDTPLQILRSALDHRKEKHLTLLCSCNEKDLKVLEEDESFLNTFTISPLGKMSKEEVLKVLKSPAGKKNILKNCDHQAEEDHHYDQACEILINLCDHLLFNQPFPGKGFECLSRAFAQKKPAEWDEAGLIDFFCDTYKVPVEIVRGYLTEDSVFYQLETVLKEKIIGQNEVLPDIAEAITAQIVLAQPQSHRPVTMLFAGSTGVGKTETTESIAKQLKLPLLSLSMGEFKSPYDTESLKNKIAEFIGKNYAGIVLFDEIEKSNPSVRDVLLNLFDKGSVGSGSDQMDCGFVICVATTNVGAHEMVQIKQAMREMDGNPKVHDSWIREKMVDEGFRPEFINRIDLACDFNDITPEYALTISKNMLNSKTKELKTNRGIELTMDESVLMQEVVKVFDSNYGARGIRRCVDTLFKRIASEKEVALSLKPGSVLNVSLNGPFIQIDVKDANGMTKKIDLKQKEDHQDQIRLNIIQQQLILNQKSNNNSWPSKHPDHSPMAPNIKEKLIHRRNGEGKSRPTM